MNTLCGIIRMAKFYCLECAGGGKKYPHDLPLTPGDAERFSVTGLTCDVCGCEIFPPRTDKGTPRPDAYRPFIQSLELHI